MRCNILLFGNIKRDYWKASTGKQNKNKDKVQGIYYQWFLKKQGKNIHWVMALFGLF